jgi:hypothetical protein
VGTGATAVTDGQQNHPAQLWKREEVLIEKYAATSVEEKLVHFILCHQRMLKS